ncbi:hypothetical protein PHLCEN_2v1724 [Hermanssonia centrifuga]|uniref:Oxidase ustYa n=1 Tax=Hermanssonia centrifuga TaxID=98765 RepID=A0A2R6RW13_9APHY|nr:hypothetical protein PHLCEN_2v1724 [Hermanssonia centrifuga]
MAIENSRHYQVDGPDVQLEWDSIYPGGDLGFIRLGPRKRFFGLSLYHQIHCLESLREAILGQGHGEGHSGVDHSSHCLNYLRQTVLCAADLTLEPEITEGTQDVGEGIAVTHVCRDWGEVHAFVQRNWEQWEALKESNGTHPNH